MYRVDDEPATIYVDGYEYIITGRLTGPYFDIPDGLYRMVSGEDESRYMYAAIRNEKISGVYLDSDQMDRHELYRILEIEEEKYNAMDELYQEMLEKGEHATMDEVYDAIDFELLKSSVASGSQQTEDELELDGEEL